MNKSDLERKLAIAKAEKKNGGNSSKTQQQRKPKRKVDESIITGDIDSLDNMVFGAPTPQNAMSPNNQNTNIPQFYDAHEEMENIKNSQGKRYDIKDSKMPRAILESIMRNPLDVEPYEDDSAEPINKSTVNSALDIVNKLENRDRKAKQINENVVNETMVQSPSTNNIDVNSLTTLIENILDKKLKQYSNTLLSESRNSMGSNIKCMKMGNGSSFVFMDSDNNVYECTMKYKGKGRTNF